MNWLQIRFTLEKLWQEPLEDWLMEQGALSVTLEDAADQPILEPELHHTPVWDQMVLTALFQADFDTGPLEQALETRFDGRFRKPAIEILEDRDWVRAWMDSYEPMQVSDRLWICPGWMEPVDPSAVNLFLDPGLAFGTGAHPTTAMCLKQLSSMDLVGVDVIDFGCGSGILAVAARLLGARKVRAIDNDPQAIVATRQNAEKNGIDDVMLETMLPRESYPFDADLVIANILANPLLSLQPVLSKLIRKNGVLVLSGILDSQVERITEAYRDVDLQVAFQTDEWMCLVGRKSQ